MPDTQDAEPIVLPPLFDPKIAVRKSVINFVEVLGAQILVAAGTYALAAPEFRAYLEAHLQNPLAAGIAVAAVTSLVTGLKNYVKNRNKGQE